LRIIPSRAFVKTLRAPLWLNSKLKTMLIIIDNKLAAGSKKVLSSYGDLMELETEGITYPAISGHPDIFFCQAPGKLIVAPNLPQRYFDQLKDHNIDYITGELPVGPEYPASARYNAVATDKYLIHNFRHTDFMITRKLEDLELIHVDQGYCRCNLLPLRDDCFIVSDEGIFKVLKGLHPRGTPSQRDSIPRGLHLNVSPTKIHLEGFPNGFFGGCCGVWNDKVFINGSLSLHPDGEKIREFLFALDYQIIELVEQPLTDVGSILFVQ
jgi:hypothetical protein